MLGREEGFVLKFDVGIREFLAREPVGSVLAGSCPGRMMEFAG